MPEPVAAKSMSAAARVVRFMGFLCGEGSHVENATSRINGVREGNWCFKVRILLIFRRRAPKPPAHQEVILHARVAELVDALD